MARFKKVNGIEVQMTANEEALFNQQEQIDAAALAARLAAPPRRISQFQFRTTLRNMNRAAAFRTYVLTLNADGQEWWQTAKFIYRNDPEVEAARTGMSLSVNQVDNVFRAAGAVEDR